METKINPRPLDKVLDRRPEIQVWWISMKKEKGIIKIEEHHLSIKLGWFRVSFHRLTLYKFKFPIWTVNRFQQSVM